MPMAASSRPKETAHNPSDQTKAKTKKPVPPPVPMEVELPICEPIAVDARQPCTVETPQVFNPLKSTLQRPHPSAQPNPTPTIPKETTPNKIDKGESRLKASPRQSEISSAVENRKVMDNILNTEVILPLRDILGTSRELCGNLQDILKLKSTSKPIAANIGVTSLTPQIVDAY